MNGTEFVLVMTLTAMLTATFVSWFSISQANSHWERKAIDAGVGEYYLDKNHDRQFRWKQQKASEE